MIKEEMEKMVDEALRWNKATGADTFQKRQESQIIPEGLSLTETTVSRYWRFREGNTIHMLKTTLFGITVYFETIQKPEGTFDSK